MSKIKWEKLLSGTDVRGKAISDQNKKANLTADAAVGIGFSFVEWLAAELNKDAKELKIAVGHDSRLSADKLKKALAKGMKTAGAECLSADLASTPACLCQQY